jgi:hypothetical protein
MGQVTVPVESIRVSTLNIKVYWVARQTVLPEDRGLEGFEMGLVPNVGMKLSPTWAPRMEVGFIYSEALRIGLGNELRLTWYGGNMGWVDGLAKAHVVITANRVAIRLVVDVVSDLEVHAAAYILYYQTIATWLGRLEVDVPYIGTDKSLATSLVLRCRGGFPELDGSSLLLALGIDIIKPYGFAFPGLIVTLSAIAKPLIEVGSVQTLFLCIADDIDVDSLR